MNDKPESVAAAKKSTESKKESLGPNNNENSPDTSPENDDTQMDSMYFYNDESSFLLPTPESRKNVVFSNLPSLEEYGYWLYPNTNSERHNYTDSEEDILVNFLQDELDNGNTDALYPGHVQIWRKAEKEQLTTRTAKSIAQHYRRKSSKKLNSVSIVPPEKVTLCGPYENSPPKLAQPPSSSSGEEVEVIFQAQATAEQKALAEKYKLPANFFLYHTAKPCPGCIGCKNDDEIDNVFKEIERRVSSGASGSMGGDENGDDVSSEEGKILFTKNATLSTKDGDVWKPLGVGEILIVYDDDVDAYRCKFHNVDSAAVLMNHLIAQPCDLATHTGKRGNFMAEWTAPDWADNPSSSIKKSFQLKFSSSLALKEFADLFKQGLEIARKNQIFYDVPSDYPFFAIASNKQPLICQEPDKAGETTNNKKAEEE